MSRHITSYGTLRAWAGSVLVVFCLALPRVSLGNEAGVAMTLALGERGDHVLTLTNATGQVWTFDRALSSCECLTIRSFPELILPGAASDVVVTVTGKKIGRFDYTVQLRGPDGTPAQALRLPAAVVPAEDAAGGVTTGDRSRDHGLYRNARVVLSATQQGASPVCLDLRDAAALPVHRIPGARPMRGFAVRSLPYDRTRPILLVDDGWGSERTERVCRRLRGEGHASVHILRGGLGAWLAAGGPVQSSSGDTGRLAAMPADVWMQQQVFADWRFIIFSGEDEGASLRLDPGHSDEEVSRAVADLLAGEQDPVRLLIVASDDQAAADYAAAARRAGADVVFYLTGGPEGLLAESRQHRQLRLASTRTETTVSRNGVSVSRAGGCGGCP